MPNTPIHNPHLVYRPDIDGLRAVAIILVIVFHAFPKLLRGGFIGVDIFFVISGYLITSIILKGLARDSFSLLEFYSRRIRRIFPALIVVLSFCLIAGWYVLLANEYEALGKHIAAGSIYISNFILQGEAGYFDTETELKPLLHLWSLAVEEQFYLFFPLLLMLSHRLHINALCIIATGFAISFVLNISQIVDSPTEVFFFPQSRIWELLVGSAVAYLTIRTHLLKRKTQKISNILSIFGISLIIFAWIHLDSKKIFFPYYWALLPTVGTACLIIAGEKAWFNRQVLASRLAVLIGFISYPLYLWHWVLLSFINITEANSPCLYIKIFILLISLLLSILTYFFVERNIRFKASNYIAYFLLIILFLIGSSGYFIFKNQGIPNRFNVLNNWIEPEYSYNYKNEIRISHNACLNKYRELSNEDFSCRIVNDIELPTVLLFGDSHAGHLYEGFVEPVRLAGGNLLRLGLGGCYPFTEFFQKESCQKLTDKILYMTVNDKSIKTVIISNRIFIENDSGQLERISHSEIKDAFLALQNSLRKTLQLLIESNKKIVFVLDVPDLEFNPDACRNRPWRYDKLAEKKICAISVSRVKDHQKKYNDAITSVLQEFPNIKVLDPLPAFCNANNCWAIKDNFMLYSDNHHLSKEGSIYLGKYFSDSIRSILLQ